MIYFATCRDANAVKIGCSVDPHGRMPELQIGCPLPVVLEAVLPGSYQEEQQFHGRFADDRIHGEWFRLTEMIELIIATHPAPPPKHEGAPKRTTKLERAPKVEKPSREDASRRRIAARSFGKRVAAGDIAFPFRTEIG